MKTKTATLLIAAVTLLTACDKNAPTTQELTPIGFTAHLDDATRVSGTNWTGGDAIGVFMIGDQTTTENKQHTTSGDGNFTPVEGDEMYYPQDGSLVDFVAYYPYSSSTDGTSLNIAIPTVQTSENISQIDLLYATAHDKGKFDSYVALPFNHAFTKIVLNTVADSDMDISLAGMTVSIIGTNTVADFDLMSGTLGTSSSPATITPRTVTDGALYEAIILPVSYGPQDVFNIEFTVDGDTYSLHLEAMEFAAGTESI
jgi:hypothetical protein